ncbi:putative phage tail protein [Acinetobacter higginsii]|uniref:putative phage tail protein n=1 Tax=Acinetobacter higginsii TaxID=70347 RepID=UPI001F4B1E03|nr:putative phage tail protein [Acinetobacter higginsii]MCH7381362.1 YmfQ family protein [Acinetobacter higginsii]
MAASKYTLFQYTSALKALLPRGRVWSRENTGIQHGLIEGLAKSFQQMDEEAQQLLVDAFPSTTTALIDEWNATLGLPDFCFGAPDNIEQNRQYIVAKLIADGGQKVNYYNSIAASLGLNTLIREFSIDHYDADAPPGMINQLEDWCHTWKVVVDSNSPALVEFNGDETAIRNSSAFNALSCLLGRYKPAHTQFYMTVFDFNELGQDPIFGFSGATDYAEPFGQGRFYR